MMNNPIIMTILKIKLKYKYNNGRAFRDLSIIFISLRPRAIGKP